MSKTFINNAIGIDEVGRGCLAGDMAVCAFKWHDVNSIAPQIRHDINDSKQLNADQREQLASALKHLGHYAIVDISIDYIASYNIHHAALFGFSKALQTIEALLPARADDDTNISIDIDGKFIPANLKGLAVARVKGDAKYAHIMAASVLAKVHRDQYMRKLHHLHPEYDWYNNKGYATSKHRQAIIKHGLTKFHRRKFCQKILTSMKSLLAFLLISL
jgi:ribonuclease HII